MDITKKYLYLSLLCLQSLIYSSAFSMKADRTFRKVFSLCDEQVLTTQVDLLHAQHNVEALINLVNSEPSTSKSIIRAYFKKNKLPQYIDDARKNKNSLVLRKLLLFFGNEAETELPDIIKSIK